MVFNPSFKSIFTDRSKAVLFCASFLFIMFCTYLVCSWQPCGHLLGKADILALLYVMLYCVIVTFPCDVLGQVSRLVVLIPDLAFFLTLCNQDAQQRFNQDGN